ncbi:hypothetical protein B0T17DRAFT_492212 [Bombardia bombarda]|uniref:DUF1917-domain-containing protein n=1 Tax=Bombardia bombarda TaxID=252184 RepID=A0AA40C4K3_9PEZI|nr:hypothetical protein B0T17DRAFT_492212 [Bombardia bombarda]
MDEPAEWPLPDETIAQFVARCPPLVNDNDDDDRNPAWYWVQSPTRSSRTDSLKDVAVFKQQATALLDAFQTELVQKKSPYFREGLRKKLKGDIAHLAKGLNVTSGKASWMLFPAPDKVNETWRVIAEAVKDTRLPVAAKVPNFYEEGNHPGTRVICVYTRDFTDEEDVKQALLELVKLGVVTQDMPKPAKYKYDAFTHLKLYRGSYAEYGLKPSIYDSHEMLGWSVRHDKSKRVGG